MGSLAASHGWYFAVVYMPSAERKSPYKWVPLGLRVKDVGKREARKLAAEVAARMEAKSKLCADGNLLFTDWISEFLEQTELTVERSTIDSYKVYADRHIIPYFTKLNLKVNEVEPQQLQRYYNVKFKNGKLDGSGGLSANTLKKHHVVLHGALEDAVRKNLIPYNPADRVVLPKLAYYEAEFLNAGQASALLEAIHDESIELVIQLTLFFGLRRSEVLGLKWSAVDFSNNRISIRNTVVQSKAIVEKNRTKNKKSRRSLPLVPEIVELFQAEKVRQAENQLFYGKEYIKNDFICKWPDGKPFRPDYVTKRFGKIIKRTGFPPVTFHGLRHSCASMMIAKGYSLKEISEWLGHSDIATTANIYGHLEFEQKINLAKGMSGILKMQEHVSKGKIAGGN